MTQTLWLCAGEPSGDAYGALIAQHLMTKNPNLLLRGMGGEKMRAVGVETFVDSTDFAVMGFVEVLGLLPALLRAKRKLLSEAKKSPPDAVVFIDYPGFNMAIAKKMHNRGIQVMWYISPKAWAWNQKRIPTMAKICDPLLSIIPFEKEFFRPWGVKTIFVGHPLIEMMNAKKNFKIEREPNTLLLLPGSRAGEIKYIFPDMLHSITALHKRRPELKYWVAASDERKVKVLQKMIAHQCSIDPDSKNLNIEIISGETIELIQRAETGLAASGTVTLECAILGLPIVSLYRLNALSNWFITHILKPKLFRSFFTLINIFENKCIYEEYYQCCIHPFTIVPAVERILPGGERRTYVVECLKTAVEHLQGDTTCAIETTADTILNSLHKGK